MGTTTKFKTIILRAAMTLAIVLMTAATAWAETVVTSSTTTMTTGIYRVTSDVTIETRITISGEVTLILDEGKTLTASNGIGVESGNTLTIEGPGTLRATGSQYNAGIGGTTNVDYGSSEHGHIIINSGIIIAQGGESAAGIGGGLNSNAGKNTIIEINGGVINATGSVSGAGIGGGLMNIKGDGAPGTIIINGGQVTARGGVNMWGVKGSGIGRGRRSNSSGSLTLGWTNSTDFIDVDSYDISNISFSKPFVIDGDETTEATVDNIGDKKIIPLHDISKFAYAGISGLQDLYLYSGTAVSLDYSVKDIDDNLLTEGTDYSTELRNSANDLISKTEETYRLTESEDYTLIFNGIGSYHGTITKNFVVVQLPQADESGAYIIQNAEDWGKLYKSVNSGAESFSGKTVKLMNDISISNAVGTNDHPFSGMFNGQGHTLTVDMTDTENQGTAPFRYISDATIEFVKVEGTVSGNMHCAGLVGFAKSGTNAIRNCVVSANVTSNGSHCGGILGHGVSSSTAISNCLFSGSISGDGISKTGIIYGWGDNGTHTIVNCLSSGTYSGDEIELIHSGNTQTINNCYRKTSGGSQGTDASTMSNDDLLAALGTGWRICNDQVVPMMDAMNLGLATVSAIKSLCLYTGSAISIDYTVTAFDGTPLEKGKDYTETFSPSPVLATGDYTLTITGNDPYTGSRTFSFTVEDASPVTSETTTMTTGYYRVTGDITVWSRITITGDVTLILSKGATLNAQCGIGVESGNTLIIEGSGTLRATGNAYNAGIGGTTNGKKAQSEHGHIIINSGTIIAQGGQSAAGIGGGNNSTAGSNTIIEFYGGVVNATGGEYGAGIGGGEHTWYGDYGAPGTIIINGGQVTAKGGKASPGIGRGNGSDTSGSLTLGWTNASDFIDVDRYDISDISLTKSFLIDSEEIIIAKVENIGGRKIVPFWGNNNLIHAKVSGLQNSYIYSGTAVSLNYSVEDIDKNPITEGNDYSTELKNSKDEVVTKTEGEYKLTDDDDYTLTFTGIGSYEGSLTKHFTVINGMDLGMATISGINDYYLSGAAISEYVVTTADGTPLEKDIHYSVEIKNGEETVSEVITKGFYTLTVTGVSPYTGSISKNFIVVGTLQTDESGAYLINNAIDWESFVYSVNNGTIDYSGKTVKLTADISISHAVGTNDHPFCGTFNGQGHTLAVDITDKEYEGTAPFRYISNATIQFVKVVGSVSGNMYCAGLVGFAKAGTNTIRSCVVATSISSIGSHCGGILGYGTLSTTTVSNCLFSGHISGACTTTGIIYGWGDLGGNHIIENCLSSGTYTTSGVELIHSNHTQPITNCYRKTNGGSQGTDASTMSNDDLVAALGNGWQILNDQVVPVMDNMNLVSATVSGINGYYLYTGETINIDYSVRAADGTSLTKDKDYTEAISPSIVQETGDYTLTITGRGSYTGAQVVNFKVMDAIPVTSETSTMTSGFYKVSEDVTIGSRITISGDVTLILNDGKALDAKEGIELSRGNKLTIVGKGTLNATGHGNWVAGIGSLEIGTLVIEGGIINANGDALSAGIGGSKCNYSGGTITIKGGTVNATGGEYGAPGIGGGSANGIEPLGMCCTINILGGKVTAIGSNGAPGIGAMDGAPTDGSITLGWTNEDDFIYSNGYGNVSSFSFAEGKCFYWTENSINTVATLDNIGGKTIVPLSAEEINNLNYLAISGVEPYYLYTGNNINIAYEVSDFDKNKLIKGTHYTESYSSTPIKDKGDYTLTLTAISGNGYTGSKTIPFTVGDGIPVTAETTKMNARYYSVPTDVTINERIVIQGDVRLLLNEGKTLTASKGIELSEGNKLTIEGKGTLIATGDDTASGIGARGVGTLVVNGGVINATGGRNAAGIGGQGNNTVGGTIIINGGKVIATGGLAAAGIGGSLNGVCGTISITGGKVEAYGTINAYETIAGIGPGYHLEEHHHSSGMVTLGLTNKDDYVYTNNGYSTEYGSVESLRIAEGQTLVDDYGNSYSGILTTEQIAAIAGKTLRSQPVVVTPPYTQDFSDGLGGWIVVDGVEGTGISTPSNPNFRFNPSSSDQYLFSPQINISGIVKMSFYARVYVDGEGGVHPASFQIGVSKSTRNISDFVWDDEVVTIDDGKIRHYQYYLPAETKYVVIRYKGVTGNWLFIDNISVEAAAIFSLADNADNTEVINTNDGAASIVTLQGRTFYRDGSWNTLCLPFAQSAALIAISPLKGATIKELDTTASGLMDDILTLNFKDATSIEAGKPYIVKWDADADLVIKTAAEWNTFAESVNNGAESFTGKTVLLGADISGVSTMVGTSEYPFCGTFDGGGHTLGLSISGGGDGAAPFQYINGAIICYVKTTGFVSGGNHTAGIVGFALGGTNSIHDCHVNASVSGSSYASGVLGNGTTSATTVRSCLFDGSLSAPNLAIFYGWGDDGGTHAVVNCVDRSSHPYSEIPLGHSRCSVTGSYSSNDVIIGVGGNTYLNALGNEWADEGEQIVLKPANSVFLTNIENPEFPSTVINKTAPAPVAFDGGTFTGTFSPLSSTTGLLFDEHNPSNGVCRAYLYIDTSNLGGFNGWYTDASLTTAVTTIPFDADGNVTLYAKLPSNIVLADDAYNGDIISDNDGQYVNVTLSNRTIYRDGNWNTLCLPFAVSDFAGTPLAGFTVMELDGTTSSLNNEGTLTLNFNYTNAIEAGKSYIAKWEGADVLIHSIEDWNAFAASVAGGNTYENQTVKLVTDIGTSQNPVTTMAGGTFKGTFDGGGHNINAVIRGSGDGTALFYHISGATIKNLRVEGWIKTDGTHPANIAALVSGVSTISNCSCWADVLSTKKLSKIDGGTVVGLINAGATLNMTDVYSRAGITYEYSSSYGGGGIVGWTGSSTTTANLERCLYSPYEVDIQYTGNEPSYYFVSGPGQKNLTKCVYDPTVVAPALTAQGRLLNYNMDDIWKYLSWDMGYDRSLNLPMTVATASADDIVNPVFGSVIIDADAETAVDFDGGKFIGTFSPVALPVNDQSNLFLGSNNTLYYPNGANNADGKYYVNACRAYFHIGNPSQVRRFVLNFNDESTETGICPAEIKEKAERAGGWYTLDGRKLSSKPTQRGIYINNGRKVVVK